MSNWKNTSNHWSKTNKRQEIINKLVKNFTHDYWKGKQRDQKTKDKISKTKKGVKVWNGKREGMYWMNNNQNAKGKIPWNKGLRGYMAGEKNVNWNGGSSFEPYGLEFNDDLKEVIRNRDRRKCFLCGRTELEENKKLSIHHKDYNKRNNDPKNLLSLCNKCHLKTNHNRNYWINYFTTITFK